MNSTSIYDVSLNEAVDLIQLCGAETTYLLQGHMGIGKSAMLSELAKRLPTHTPVYFDCTTKDLGDIMLPRIAEAGADAAYVSFAPNEELGLHLGKPIILMIDELGKANPAVKNALTRLLYERKSGSYSLPEGSIVFATTNLAGEGVGDLLMAHQWNRISVLTVRKPSHIEWLEWAINNRMNPALMGWVKEHPELFQTFDEVKDPTQNPYIFHPRDPSRKAFVTPRSLERASNIIDRVQGKVADSVLTSALIGTLGARAAMDLMAFVQLTNDLPSWSSIVTGPATAKIPNSAAAICMVVYRALSIIKDDEITPFMEYLMRLDPEAQGLFANGVRAPAYHMQSKIMLNKSFTQFVQTRAYLFGSDQ